MDNLQEVYVRYSAEEKKVAELYHLIALRLGLSDSAFWVLYCLCHPEPLRTQNDIARQVGLPKQTVHSAVSRLLEMGYVRLEQMAVAGNNKQILLTEQGRAFCRQHIAPVQAAEEQAFNRLPEAEQETYLALSFKHSRFIREELRTLLNQIPEGEL